MYYGHFGLDQPPFRITPNTDFFFGGGNRGAILEALIYAITHGEGIVKVTGEVGSGKTMLCNMLQARLPAPVETVYLAHPNVTPDEILHAIAFELQLGVERGTPRIELMHKLQDYLLQRHAEGRRVVMFVEESQSMPLATLEEIRLLSNLETRNEKLLQIVLFGQPELDENLRDGRIRQLKERITHSFRLGPLSTAETRDYLMFRLRAAGYRGPDLFPDRIARYIARASSGLTRRINLIADKALLAAFSENTHTVRLRHVTAAVRDSDFGQDAHPARGLRIVWGAALLLIGALTGALALAWLGESALPVDARKSDGAVHLPSSAGTRANGESPAGMDSPSSASEGRAPMATPAPSAGPDASGALPTLVEQRIAMTREWLAEAAPTTYSIQLMGIQDESQLTLHLNDMANFIEVNKVFLYRTVANRKASMTVLYGSFSDRRAAQNALETLPAALKVNRPILRTVRGIRTEIMRHWAS